MVEGLGAQRRSSRSWAMGRERRGGRGGVGVVWEGLECLRRKSAGESSVSGREAQGEEESQWSQEKEGGLGKQGSQQQ